MNTNTRGYISVPILFFLLMLMVMVFGAGAFAFYLRQSSTEIAGFSDSVQGFAKVKQEFVKSLLADPSPETDSVDDPVFALNNAVVGQFTLKVEDVSSKLPLNWINLNIIENTPLIKALKPGVSIQQISDMREEKGYAADLNTVYAELINKGSLQKLFTAWGWVNLNVGAEEVLGDIYQFRVGSSGSAVEFRSRVKQKFMSKELWTLEDQMSALGMSANLVYPTINALPLMNINFVPADIVGAVIGYPFPDGKIENGGAVAASLIARRDGGAIDPNQLKAAIPITKPQQQRVFSYLGCRTWFWKVIAKSGETTWGLYFCVIPDLAKTSAIAGKGIIKLISVADESKAETSTENGE